MLNAKNMIDEHGFRANIGIILMNDDANLLWARRLGQNAWQFPQGGMHPGETSEDALYRELYEEVGLIPEDVKIVGATQDWLHYRIPDAYLRRDSRPLCIGQKQKWYLLKLLSNHTRICLDRTDSPEFDAWRWVTYWYPIKRAVYFKRQVYKRALKELGCFVFDDTSLT
jgi:putative (di)nucleoside polyphosphate hydrolase